MHLEVHVNIDQSSQAAEKLNRLLDGDAVVCTSIWAGQDASSTNWRRQSWCRPSTAPAILASTSAVTGQRA
ncbi:hypothetical protein [Streptomyces lycii]|uniref:Uncharacterized protein n=1 Tax=Streptomyces lycii TaxID=2654337 RepID=A0ABQ7FA71_9ACTN|nr:hypothetical protein [Streptomyces lycii]KAF4405931.1 hypothetical protein GCU69_27685 [Streptomyces lycii]